MTWRYEDGGPRRRQTAPGGLGIRPGDTLETTTRTAPAITMVVGRVEGELFLLRHTAGDGAIAIVERIDGRTLEPLAQSPELAAGPVWPGGLGAHDNGSIYVVFGNHAHRLDADLRVVASRTLPRDRPYNSFVTLPDGHLVTKDFGGSRPGVTVAPDQRVPCELVVLEPDGLEIVDRLVLPEPSIARLSADGNDVYVVGDTNLLRVRWNGARLTLDEPSRRVTGPSTARPTAGTASSRQARRGSSTTATAPSATPARCGATASRARRSTSCASTLPPPTWR